MAEKFPGLSWGYNWSGPTLVTGKPGGAWKTTRLDSTTLPSFWAAPWSNKIIKTKVGLSWKKLFIDRWEMEMVESGHFFWILGIKKYSCLFFYVLIQKIVPYSAPFWGNNFSGPDDVTYSWELNFLGPHTVMASQPTGGGHWFLLRPAMKPLFCGGWLGNKGVMGLVH